MAGRASRQHEAASVAPNALDLFDLSARQMFARTLGSFFELTQELLENTPAVVYVKDIQGRYLYANRRYTELFASESESVIGKTDFDIFCRESAEDFQENDRKVIETRQKMTMHETAPHSDGKHTYVSVKFPLFDAQDRVTAVAGISTDVTDQLQNQQFQNELSLAATFQNKLFPSKAPTIPGLDLAAWAVPVTQLCGDYYDFIPTGPDRIVVAVGDVSGHGLGPALAMVEVRATLRGILRSASHHGLARVLYELNQLLCDDFPDAIFVSLFVAEIDYARGTIEFGGAGHEAMFFRTDGSIQLLKSTGPILGVLESATYDEPESVSVSRDDFLLIFTDGVTEAMNEQHELFGVERVAEYCKQNRQFNSQQLIHRLFARVIEFADSRPVKDDMTALAMKFQL